MSESLRASGSNRCSLTQLMTAVLRTYGLESWRPVLLTLGKYSMMFGSLSEVKLLNARPRVIGSSSRQSFCRVLIASRERSGLVAA